jgi:hypothetical protein
MVQVHNMHTACTYVDPTLGWLSSVGRGAAVVGLMDLWQYLEAIKRWEVEAIKKEVQAGYIKHSMQPSIAAREAKKQTSKTDKDKQSTTDAQPNNHRISRSMESNNFLNLHPPHLREHEEEGEEGGRGEGGRGGGDQQEVKDEKMRGARSVRMCAWYKT